ncbi:Glutamate decarboxylase 2 [Dichanthelium oligosanthes]|uniref:Glutamate decarboxylase n=1 Tax=Dichanthelium oligosanthes TaxID=888268 RepID=A0A1E5VK03_9POAL|nr:Glutamate decarboxylase 2 [Dichanthelium oligosanthes]
MVLTHVQELDEASAAVFASRYVQDPLPRYELGEKSISKDAAYQIIHDELLLDSSPRLNLASFVTTWMEPECDKLMLEAINKNYADMDEYPNRCVNIIARLFNAPVDAGEKAVGVGTVGSSEAIMLAGLAFKRRWQNRRKAAGKPYDKPNIVTGANVQVCWEKFARYFEVELKEVKLREGCYVMDPDEAVRMVDENTICVAAILGSTLTGEFEDVRRVNDLLAAKNKRTGWDTPIHVDAASGGFIAPFLYPELEWDFRLPLVKSINVSGHKYGLVYAGVGWVIWRNKEDLPEDLIFHINYLGADQPTFTLNFSKGTTRSRLPHWSSQIIAQYYQFLRLGFEGYRNVMENCMESTRTLREGLERMGRFTIISKEQGVPLVAFTFKDRKDAPLAFRLSSELRRFGWIVPAYTMPADLEHMAVLRVVVREDFGRPLAERFLSHVRMALGELDDAAKGGPVPRMRVTIELGPAAKGSSEEATARVVKREAVVAVHRSVSLTGGKTKGVC